MVCSACLDHFTLFSWDHDLPDEQDLELFRCDTTQNRILIQPLEYGGRFIAALTVKANIDRFLGLEKVHGEQEATKERRQILNKHETVVFRKVDPTFLLPFLHRRFPPSRLRLRSYGYSYIMHLVELYFRGGAA